MVTSQGSNPKTLGLAVLTVILKDRKGLNYLRVSIT